MGRDFILPHDVSSSVRAAVTVRSSGEGTYIYYRRLNHWKGNSILSGDSMHQYDSPVSTTQAGKDDCCHFFAYAKRAPEPTPERAAESGIISYPGIILERILLQ